MADKYPVVLDDLGTQELGPGSSDTLVVENINIEGGFKLPQGSTKPTSPADGDLWYDNSSGERVLYVYDGNRSKWLSSSEYTLQWGHDNADGQLLRGPGVIFPGSGTGVLIPHDCTIVRITAHQRTGPATKQIDVLVNGSSVLNFSLSSDVYKSNTVDQDINEDDELWVEADSAESSSSDLTVVLWIAWRG
jgi:hypothetical protein